LILKDGSCLVSIVSLELGRQAGDPGDVPFIVLS